MASQQPQAHLPDIERIGRGEGGSGGFFGEVILLGGIGY